MFCPQCRSEYRDGFTRAEVRGLLDGLEDEAAARHLADDATEDERDREPEV